MLLGEIMLLAVSWLLLRAATDGCRCRGAVEFWSDVVCSMENCKTVNFHRVFDSNEDSACVRRCFDSLVRDIARKCETTIVSRTYTLPNSVNASFAGNKHIAGRALKRSSMWKITPDDVFLARVTPPATRRISIRRNQTIHGRNTWNIHVILATDVRSFAQISRKEPAFQWNSRDRFIVLIAHRKEREDKGQQDGAKLTGVDEILKMLWFERKVYNVFVSQGIFARGAARADRLICTYDPFARVNDSAWGKVHGMNVETVEWASRVMSNLTAYQRTKDLNGYELKVGMFDDNQSSIKATKDSVRSDNTMHSYSDVVRGFDETLLKVVMRHMNFQVKRIYPRDKSYGYQLRNGTYVGAIGDVVYGRTDVCFQSFFIKKYSGHYEDVEFTTHVEYDKVCVIVPKASKIPKWFRIFHLFPLSIWICSMLSHVLIYVTWYFLQVSSPQRCRTERINFLTTAYRSFLLNCGCPQKLPNTNAERILLTGILLANITIVGIFNSILYQSFANDMYYRDIETFEDLDASGLPIIFTSHSMRDIFGPENETDTEPLMRRLKEKLQHGYNGVTNAALHRNVSGLMRKHHFSVMGKMLLDADGAPMIHLIKGCPGTYYLSYLLPNNSILSDRINGMIGRLNQAGLPALWTGRNIRRLIAQKNLPDAKNMNEMDRFVPFNLSDLQTSFCMLLVGLSLSTVMFCHEKGWLTATFSGDKRSSSKTTRDKKYRQHDVQATRGSAGR